MSRSRARFVGLALLLLLVACLASARAVQAQQPASLTFIVTEDRVPGAAGTGTITSLGNNQLRVDVRLTGLPPNGSHAMHVHIADGARCDTGAPIVYPLTNVQVDGAGVGTSTSTITLRADQPIRSGNAYINVHRDATVPSPGIICANIDASFASGTAGTGGTAPQRMPSSGTGSVSDTRTSRAVIVVLLVIPVLGGGLRLRRPGRWAPRG
jgi:hypothetical protein